MFSQSLEKQIYSEITALYAIPGAAIPVYIRDGLRPESMLHPAGIDASALTPIPDVKGSMSTSFSTDKGPRWEQEVEIHTSERVWRLSLLCGHWFIARIDTGFVLIGDPTGHPPTMSIRKEYSSSPDNVLKLSAVMLDRPVDGLKINNDAEIDVLC